MEDARTKIDWMLPRELLPKNRVKLLLNLMLLAGMTVPRGGVIQVAAVGAAPEMGFSIASTGVSARIPQAILPCSMACRRKAGSTPTQFSPSMRPAGAGLRPRARLLAGRRDRHAVGPAGLSGPVLEGPAPPVLATVRR